MNIGKKDGVKMFNIEKFLDLTGYELSRLDRRNNNKEGKPTAEFFTPYFIVKHILDYIIQTPTNCVRII